MSQKFVIPKINEALPTSHSFMTKMIWNDLDKMWDFCVDWIDNTDNRNDAFMFTDDRGVTIIHLFDSSTDVRIAVSPEQPPIAALLFHGPNLKGLLDQFITQE